jgi:hypothetical protein
VIGESDSAATIFSAAMRSKQRAASMGALFDFPGLVLRPRPNLRLIISSP